MYYPEKTMRVCRKCHARIHHSELPEYSKFRPERARPKYYPALVELLFPGRIRSNEPLPDIRTQEQKQFDGKAIMRYMGWGEED
jgi:hypothetical protein